MQVILLVKLPLKLAVNREPQQVGILLSCCQAAVKVRLPQHLLEIIHCPACCIHLFTHAVLEVTTQVFDFLDLEVQIGSKTSKSKNNILFDFTRLLILHDCLLVLFPEHLQSIIEATRREKSWRCANVVETVRQLHERLGAMFVVVLNVAEVCDQVLENLSPCCQANNEELLERPGIYARRRKLVDQP